VRFATTILVLLAIAGTPAAAQDRPCAVADGGRPSVGLVLSGGGALGAAHVGVLRVLEELRVPVDCVAGTSMGAIVGGLYAMGLSADELDQRVSETDWRDLLDDATSRRELPFRRKVDDLTYLAPVEVGFNHGRFQLPPGVIVGQKLGLELQRLTAPAAAVASFDRLPIPFRTVATDLETGTPVVLADGDLGRAIRASMAVPGVFSPIVIDGRMLVDGGVVMNLPVELARAMGADVIVAVQVLPSPKTRDELRSLAGQVSQTVSLMIAQNMDEQARDADVLIRTDVGAYRASDFGKVAEMIPIGEAAARELEPVLRTLSLSEEAWRAHLDARHGRTMRRFETIESVQIDIGSTADPEAVLDRVTIRPGDPFDLERIARDVQRLWDLGTYERVDFYATPGEHGAIVHLEAHDRSWGPNVMRFGLNLVTDFAGESLFNVLANYTMTGLGRAAAEAKFAVRVGEETGAFAEWYQPLSRDSRFFVAPVVGATRFGVDALLDPSLFGDYKVSAGNLGVDLGISFGKWGEARFGAIRGSGTARPREGPSVLPEIDFDWGGWQASVVIDQLDNPNFPQDGFIFGAELLIARESFGSDSDYDRLLADFTGASTWGRHTLIGTVELGTALGSEIPFWQEFELGGLFRLSGYDPGTFSGPYLTHGLLGWYYRVGNVATGFGDGIYVGLSFEAGNVWETTAAIDVDGLRYAGSVFVGVDTIFGPMYLAYGHAEDGQGSFYLFVGRSF